MDLAGLKVFDEGEWEVRKRSAEKRRVWCKFSLAVDTATHDIVAAEVSLENVYDAEVLPTLLTPLLCMLGRINADDCKACNQLIEHKGLRPVSCLEEREVMRKGASEK